MPDILKLARAKVGDDTIVAFVKNSGKAYSLGVPEILYLRQQGLSDQVLAAMLTQRQPATEAAAASPAPAPVPTAPPTAPATAETPPTGSPAANNPPAAPANTQPPVTSVPSAPAYVPSSTVYVAPPAYVYYDYYPYYYPYYGWYSYPAVSLSFGFGAHRNWGGFHGGGFHGGGFHGGPHR